MWVVEAGRRPGEDNNVKFRPSLVAPWRGESAGTRAMQPSSQASQPEPERPLESDIGLTVAEVGRQQAVDEGHHFETAPGRGESAGTRTMQPSSQASQPESEGPLQSDIDLTVAEAGR